MPFSQRKQKLILIVYLISSLLLQTSNACQIKEMNLEDSLICQKPYKNKNGDVLIGPEYNISNPEDLQTLAELFFLSDSRLNSLIDGSNSLNEHQILTIMEQRCPNGDLFTSEIPSEENEDLRISYPTTTPNNYLFKKLDCFKSHCNQGEEIFLSFSFRELRFDFFKCLRLTKGPESALSCIYSKLNAKYPCIFNSCRPFDHIKTCLSKNFFSSTKEHKTCIWKFFEKNSHNIEQCRSAAENDRIDCFLTTIRQYLAKLNDACPMELISDFFECVMGKDQDDSQQPEMSHIRLHMEKSSIKCLEQQINKQ